MNSSVVNLTKHNFSDDTMNQYFNSCGDEFILRKQQISFLFIISQHLDGTGG